MSLSLFLTAPIQKALTELFDVTFDKIEFDKMETITRLVFYTAWELANREERIKLKEQKP